MSRVPESPLPNRGGSSPRALFLRRAGASLRIIGEIAGVLVLVCALYVFAGGLGMLFWWLVAAFARGFDPPAPP